MTIFLDMDGVVSDAHHAFCHAIGRPELLTNWPAGEFQVYKVAGITQSAMWRMVDEAGVDFWANMRMLPWAHRLYDGLNVRGKVVFLTEPSYDPQCVAGKVKWLQDFTGQGDFRDYIITPHKSLLAAPGRVLIDDSPSNCQKFRKAGGQAIQFPAMWAGFEEKYILGGAVDALLNTIQDMSER